LPALVVVWIRFYVNEPEVWVENKRQQREIKAEVKAPLLSIFRRGLLFNTLTACFWIASTFCVYYSIWALFSAYLQKELTEASHRSFLRRRLSAPPVGYWHSAARLRYAIVSEIGG
jgi:hypothetical protein